MRAWLEQRSISTLDWNEVPEDGELHPRVRRHVREMVLAEGASEEEATVLLLVIERLRRIQAERGVSAAENAALAVRDIWLES